MFKKILANGLVLGLMTVSHSAFAEPTGEQYKAQAEEALKKGDSSTALIHLKNGMRIEPNNQALRLMLADLYMSRGQFNLAEKEYETLLEQGMDDTKFVVALAESYQRQAKYEELLEKIKDGNRGNEIESKISLTKGFAKLAKGDNDGAFALITKAIELNPKDVNLHLGMVSYYISRDDLVKAEQTIDTLNTQFPNDAKVLSFKAEFLKNAGKSDEAIDFYSKALAVDPKFFQARVGRAQLLIAKNDDVLAGKDIQFLEENFSGHPIANYLSALLLSKNNSDDKAQEKLMAMGGYLNNYPPALYLMGLINYRNDRLEQAESNLRMLLGLTPKSVQARLLLSNLYLTKKTPQRAIDLLNEIVNAQTTDKTLLTALSNAYIQAGQYVKAAEILEKVSAAAPEDQMLQTRLALTKLQTGEADKAIEDLKAIVAKDPQNQQTKLVLAVTLLDQGKLDESEKVILELQKEMKEKQITSNLLGGLYMKQNKIEEAKEQFKNAIKEDPKFTSAYINLAQAFTVQKNLDEAIKTYKKVLSVDDTNLKALIGLSAIEFQRDNKKQGIRYIEEAIAKNPKNTAPALRLINYYLVQKESQKALELAREQEKNNPDDVMILDSIGRAQLALNQPEGAIDTYRKITTISPNLPMGYYRIAQAMALVKNVDGAKRNLMQSIEVNKEFLLGYRELIIMELQDKNYAAAIKIADLLKSNNPKSPMGDMFAGDLYLQSGQKEKALERFKAGAQIQNNSQLVGRFYQYYMLDKKPAEAEAALTEWLKTNPKDGEILFVLGSHYLQNGQEPKAVEQYEKLLVLNPDNSLALNNMAWIYLKSNDAKALDYAKRAYAVSPNIAEVADTYAWILAKSGKIDEAFTVISPIAAQAENNYDIQYHYAYILHQKGDKNKAKSILEKITAIQAAYPEKENAQNLLKELKA